MALNQGYQKLLNGYTKTLNVSEKQRGWLFITKDAKGLRLIQPSAKVSHRGKVRSFRVDRFGRLLTGKQYIASLPDSFHVYYKDGVLEIDDETT